MRKDDKSNKHSVKDFMLSLSPKEQGKTKGNDIFKSDVVRSLDEHLSSLSPNEQSQYLKYLINQAGIIRQQLPTESNENELMGAFCREMVNPFRGAVVNKAKFLLKKDRADRMVQNFQKILKKMNSASRRPSTGRST